MIIRDYYEQLCSNKLDNLEEMDTFLETYKLPELNHEEKENLNRSYKQGDRISIKKTSKVQEQMASQVNATKHSRKS